jgi:hypothetical protein
MNLALATWRLSFQLSPIILTNGIAAQIPGGMLPIIALTEALNFVDGLLSGPSEINLDSFFATFQSLPGASLIEQEIGEYTFANQAVAANATIADPLNVSMVMICPVKNTAGYPLKLATMMALQAALTQHNGSGGTYTIATPSAFYTNCIMLAMRDVTSGESNQPQTMWQMDFRRPLLTQDQLSGAQGNLMSQLSGGGRVPANADGSISWSGLAPTLGNPPSLATPGLLPSATGSAAAGVAGAGNGIINQLSSLLGGG